MVSGCSTIVGQQEILEIHSSPRAHVYLMSESSTPVRLGTTPFKIKSDEVFSKNNASSLIRLRVSSPGHVDEWFLFDAKNTFGKLSFRLRPSEWWNDKSNISPSRVAQLIGSSVRDVYKLIRQGKNSEARRDIERLQKQFPHAPIFYDLLGSLSVLDNNNDQAIRYYEQSLKLSPDNRETAETLEKLKRGNP